MLNTFLIYQVFYSALLFVLISTILLPCSIFLFLFFSFPQFIYLFGQIFFHFLRVLFSIHFALICFLRSLKFSFANSYRQSCNLFFCLIHMPLKPIKADAFSPPQFSRTVRVFYIHLKTLKIYPHISMKFSFSKIIVYNYTLDIWKNVGVSLNRGQ